MQIWRERLAIFQIPHIVLILSPVPGCSIWIIQIEFFVFLFFPMLPCRYDDDDDVGTSRQLGILQRQPKILLRPMIRFKLGEEWYIWRMKRTFWGIHGKNPEHRGTPERIPRNAFFVLIATSLIGEEEAIFGLGMEFKNCSNNNNFMEVLLVI